MIEFLDNARITLEEVIKIKPGQIIQKHITIVQGKDIPVLNQDKYNLFIEFRFLGEENEQIIKKKIAKLQNLEEFGNIWNITYITLAFNTLNIKINPENGEILNHNLESLMNLIKK